MPFLIVQAFLKQTWKPIYSLFPRALTLLVVQGALCQREAPTSGTGLRNTDGNKTLLKMHFTVYP